MVRAHLPGLFGDVWTLRLPIETTNLAPDLLSAHAVREAYRSTASAEATPPSPKGYIQNYWENRRTGKGSRTRAVVILEPVFAEMRTEQEQRAIEEPHNPL
jgi:hypothetical protein